MDGAGELRTALERLLRSIFPRVFLARTTLRARVVNVREAGGRMDALDPRYSVDVEILDRDGQPDPAWPVIPDVELPMLWAGRGRGVYCVPDVGTIVRVGFYEGDQNQPYVEALTGSGHSCPEHPVGRFMIVSGDTRIEITPVGDIEIRGGQVQIRGPTEVHGDASVHGAVQVDGPVAAGSLSVGGVSVPGSPRSGTILIAPQSTVSIEVQNGMVMDWS